MSRRQARRLSRRFAGVGVRVSPGRLRDIAAGAQCADDEWVDVGFAVMAVRALREERWAKVRRMRRRSGWWLVGVGLFLAALNFLACLAYVMFSLIQQTTQY
jgi:hypothetical protein